MALEDVMLLMVLLWSSFGLGDQNLMKSINIKQLCI